MLEILSLLVRQVLRLLLDNAQRKVLDRFKAEFTDLVVVVVEAELDGREISGVLFFIQETENTFGVLVTEG